MKKLFGFLSVTFLLASCGKDNVEYLYNKYDKDYDNVQAMYSEKCEQETQVLIDLDKTNDFTEIFKEKTTRYFKAERKETFGDKRTITTYIKIQKTSDPATMDVYVVTSNEVKGGDKQNYYFPYSQTQNKNLLGEIVKGVCSTNKEFGTPTFNSSYVRFSPARESSVSNDEFEKKSETYTVKVGQPIFLHRVYGQESYHKKENGTEEKWSYASGVLNEIDTCDTTLCNTLDNAGKDNCTLDVAKDFYKSKLPTEMLTSLKCTGFTK